jgi:hypothetical protein
MILLLVEMKPVLIDVGCVRMCICVCVSVCVCVCRYIYMPMDGHAHRQTPTNTCFNQLGDEYIHGIQSDSLFRMNESSIHPM